MAYYMCAMPTFITDAFRHDTKQNTSICHHAYVPILLPMEELSVYGITRLIFRVPAGMLIIKTSISGWCVNWSGYARRTDKHAAYLSLLPL